MKMEEAKEISTEELEKRIENWRNQFIKDFNNSYVGLSFTDVEVSASALRGLISDVQVILQWMEILSYKIKKLEENNLNK